MAVSTTLRGLHERASVRACGGRARARRCSAPSASTCGGGGLRLVDIAAEDDLVFVHWRAIATHEGQHQMTKHVRDIEPTGEEETVSGISLYRIEGGKIVESW